MTGRWRARAIPLLIRTVGLVVRPLTMGVRGMVLDGAGRVLLVRHGYIPGWHLPGGGVEGGETVRVALARELAEEAHVAITSAPALHGVFLQRPRDHVAVYVVRDFRVTGERSPDWEIAETGFFPTDALPEGTTAATRRRLGEVLEGVPAAETW